MNIYLEAFKRGVDEVFFLRSLRSLMYDKTLSVLSFLSRTLNMFLGGTHQESLCVRVYRESLYHPDPVIRKRRAKQVKLLDALFFLWPNHCERWYNWHNRSL